MSAIVSFVNSSLTRSPRAKFLHALPLSALFLLGGPLDAQAGFIEDLFGSFGGGQQRAAEAPSSAPSRAERPKRREFQSSLGYLKGSKKRQPAARKDGGGKVAGAGPVKKGFCYAQAPQSADPGEAEALLHDSTLRAGDTIATAEGLRVYSGGGGCPHKSEDFLALASARNLKGSQRNSLLAIENAMKTRVGIGQVRSLLFSSTETVAH
jgi:hypothetical protein